jgi:hypothetical protein
MQKLRIKQLAIALLLGMVSLTHGQESREPGKSEKAEVSKRPAGKAVAGSLPLVINEIMAANHRTIMNPQGVYADWIELFNSGKEELDLSGLHLSEDKNKLRKWTFPSGTKIGPGEHLIVWADKDTKATTGLHTNFKLSMWGESVLLVDRDKRGNAIIDSVEFGPQQQDVSFGRYPDGKNKWQLMPPSPGKPNSEN